MSFLDNEGLAKVWANILSQLSKKSDKFVEQYTSYYGSNHQNITDLLQINTGRGNEDCSIGVEDASTLRNSPVTSGKFYAYRRVYQVYSSSGDNYKTTVELHEIVPKRGRIWKRDYDPESGWASNGSYVLTDTDTIPASNIDTIPISGGGTGRTSRTAGLTALLAGSSITGDLNFIDSGVYAFSTNDCTNCPPYSSWYLLLVFRYAEGDKACVQIATTLGNPRHTYIRTSSVNGTFTSWVQLTNFTDSDGVKLELNADMRNLETGIYFNRGRSAGNKYSLIYEADDDFPELSIRQHTPTYDKVFRLCSNADYMWIQSDGSLYIGNSSHPVTRIYTNDYGSTLPSAGSKGRIFFKKV